MIRAPGFGSKGPGLNPVGEGIQLMTVRAFIAQTLSLLSFHHLDMTSNNVESDVKYNIIITSHKD